MYGSKLPIQYWFMAMYLIISTKKPFSVKEAQRQLGHKRYGPILAMAHKIRQLWDLRMEDINLRTG